MVKDERDIEKINKQVSDNVYKVSKPVRTLAHGTSNSQRVTTAEKYDI